MATPISEGVHVAAQQMLNIEIIFSSSVSFLIASRSCKNLAELLNGCDGEKSAKVQNL
jgi:hypothetical protein